MVEGPLSSRVQPGPPCRDDEPTDTPDPETGGPETARFIGAAAFRGL